MECFYSSTCFDLCFILSKRGHKTNGGRAVVRNYTHHADCCPTHWMGWHAGLLHRVTQTLVTPVSTSGRMPTLGLLLEMQIIQFHIYSTILWNLVVLCLIYLNYKNWGKGLLYKNHTLSHITRICFSIRVPPVEVEMPVESALSPVNTGLPALCPRPHIKVNR